MSVLQAYRKANKLTQQELAERVGTSQPQIRRLENGERKLTREWAEKLAPHLGITPAQLLFGLDLSQSDTAKSGILKPPPAFFSEDRNMPVYAAAEGGGGHIIVTTDTVEYVRRPYTLEAIPEAYGILIVGESMVPAFEPGDTAWVNPRLPPLREVDVILYAEDGNGDHKATIKRLTGWTEKEWHLRQYNPAKDFKLRRDEWPKLHRVVGKFSRR